MRIHRCIFEPPGISRLIILAVALTALGACSPKKAFVKEFAEMMAEGANVYEQEADLDLLEKAFPATIKLMESLLVSSPDDSELLVLLARTYGGYNLLFQERKLEVLTLSPFREEREKGDSENAVDMKARLGRYYERGVQYALRALEVRHPGAAQRLEKLDAIDDFLESMKPSDVPALFWYGYNLGSWVHHRKDSVVSLSKAHIAEKAMQRVIALSPEYYYGGAHLFLVSFYGSRPSMMGGNRRAAVFHYDAMKSIAGSDFLMADFYYARFVLLQQQDKAAFTATLDRVVSRSRAESAYPLFNAAAALRARIYLDAADRLFD